MDPILREILASGAILEVAGSDRIKAVGTLNDRVRELIRTNKPALLIVLTSQAHYRWRVVGRDGLSTEVCCLPELTHLEMSERYPGAKLAPLLPSAELPELAAA